MVPPKPISIPPPSNWTEVVLPLPIVMFLSPMFRVAESIDVVVPLTSKLPPTLTLPVVVTLAKSTSSVVPTLWFPNEPLMSDAICAELDRTPLVDNKEPVNDDASTRSLKIAYPKFVSWSAPLMWICCIWFEPLP